jgi:hypothetical protein
MTDPAAVLGSLGVGLLLLAFVLNGVGRLSSPPSTFIACTTCRSGTR